MWLVHFFLIWCSGNVFSCLLTVFISLFLQELEGNEDTDDESSISNDDGSLASESEDVQNDVVVKLEEVAVSLQFGRRSKCC